MKITFQNDRMDRTLNSVCLEFCNNNLESKREFLSENIFIYLSNAMSAVRMGNPTIMHPPTKPLNILDANK